MYYIGSWRLRNLVFITLCCLGSALLWSGGCNKPKPRAEKLKTSPAASVISPTASAKEDNAIAYRLARDTELSRQRETLASLMQDAYLSASVRAEAETEMWRLTRVEASEHDAEAILAAEGWPDLVVTVVGQEVRVVVNNQGLTAADAAVIGKIVAQAVGCGEEEVMIKECP